MNRSQKSCRLIEEKRSLWREIGKLAKMQEQHLLGDAALSFVLTENDQTSWLNRENGTYMYTLLKDIIT